MTELQILEKIVNTISGDHDFRIKCDTKEETPGEVLTSYPAKHKPATHTYTLMIKRQRRNNTKRWDVIYCYARVLSRPQVDQIAKNHSGNVFNELALQAIIDLGCKGIQKVL